MKRVVIIGGGASGVLAAIHVLRATDKPLHVSLYELSQEVGAGLAYGTKALEHILNVPADRMSCDEREPEDFQNWLQEEKPQVFHDRHFPFVSRSYYKEYLQQRLREAAGGHELIRLQERVTQITFNGRQWNIESISGQQQFDICVVATGYSTSTHVPHVFKGCERLLVDTPYASSMDVTAFDQVAVIGMGLTAIDIWRTLRYKGFNGKIHFLSRRALFPHAFSIGKDVSPLPEVPQEASPLFLLRWVRALMHFEECDATAVAQLLRPYVSDIWKNWSEFQKKQFLTHARPYWETIRHRLPDTVHEELMSELKAGRAMRHKAKGLKASLEGEQVLITFPQGQIKVDKVFIATGAQLAPVPLKENPSLYEKCRLGLGYKSRNPSLHFVGPITRTTHWEISAVPEIRIQAQALGAEVARLIN